MASWRAVQSADMGWRKSEHRLQELDMLLEQLEELFSFSLVPRVLLYDINMEALVLSPGIQNLQVSSGLRKLFRTLYATDLLSDTSPVSLMSMSTTVLVLAHRDVVFAGTGLN